jgi:hypothetical protein
MENRTAGSGSTKAFETEETLQADFDSQWARLMAGEITDAEWHQFFAGWEDRFKESHGADAERDEFSLGYVARITHLNPAVIDSWIRRGLFASTRAASGSGSRRAFSFTDVVMLSVAALLLSMGVAVRDCVPFWDRIRSLGDLERLPVRAVLVRRLTGEVYVVDEATTAASPAELACIRVAVWYLALNLRNRIKAERMVLTGEAQQLRCQQEEESGSASAAVCNT